MASAAGLATVPSRRSSGSTFGQEQHRRVGQSPAGFQETLSRLTKLRGHRSQVAAPSGHSRVAGAKGRLADRQRPAPTVPSHQPDP